MPTVAVVYFSAQGHTQQLAEAVAEGARSVPGTAVEVHRIVGEDIQNGRWKNPVITAALTAADAIVLRARADSLATGLRWQWAGPGTTAADTLPTLAARQAGTYRLTARLGACFSTDSVTLRAAPCTVYNVVTPNADGRNDGLTVELPGQWTLEVYSRWGRRVWASAPGGYESGTWPTAAEAADLPASTYFYHLTRPADGRRLRGWVQVVR